MEIKINNKTVEAKKGETILDVAKRSGFNIPTLCYHSDVKNHPSCRVCVVDVNGKLFPACSTKVESGMDINIKTEKTEKARKINLELLFSQHQEECDDCIWNMNCKMLDLAKEYKVTINRFKDRKDDYPVYNFGPALEYDSTKCIDCRNCVKVCKEQGVEYLEIKGRGHLMEIVPSKKDDRECVYCGQCIVHCPAGAFEAVGEFEGSEKPFADKEKQLIFQIAPSIRSTIGEEFGMPHEENLTGKLVTALRKLGSDMVFDVSFGADITTVEESKEFLEKIETNNLPLMTSCCPAWVRYVEFYYPEFIPHLTTVRSPHIILGGVVKEQFPESMVVSVMPCVAKKYEIERSELWHDGVKPVDYVMTTRELGRLLKRKGVDFENLLDGEMDNPFGLPTGSGVGYGVSGGVMQSAFYNVSGKTAEFHEIKKGVRVAKVEFEGKKLTLAVVHGLGNAKLILEELKSDSQKYDYIEVMACPGGCIGGGGQSVPVDEEIRTERKGMLCRASGERSGKRAGENEEVKNVYTKFLNTKENVSKICYTKFERKKNESKNNCN
jgi:iron-only hydrogenase group A